MIVTKEITIGPFVFKQALVLHTVTGEQHKGKPIVLFDRVDEELLGQKLGISVATCNGEPWRCSQFGNTLQKSWLYAGLGYVYQPNLVEEIADRITKNRSIMVYAQSEAVLQAQYQSAYGEWKGLVNVKKRIQEYLKGC